MRSGAKSPDPQTAAKAEAHFGASPDWGTKDPGVRPWQSVRRDEGTEKRPPLAVEGWRNFRTQAELTRKLV